MKGAAQSIEDAYVLTRCLHAFAEAPRALAEYEQRRKERTSRLQQQSRDNERLFHLADPELVRQRNERIRAEPTGAPSAFAWVYSYDVEQAMALPPLGRWPEHESLKGGCEGTARRLACAAVSATPGTHMCGVSYDEVC